MDYLHDRPTGHDDRSVTRPFFTTRHSHAKKLDASRLWIRRTRVGFLEVGIAGINAVSPQQVFCAAFYSPRGAARLHLVR